MKEHTSYERPSAELQRQLEEGQRWATSGGKTGQAVCLAYEDHAGMDLTEASLQESMLQEANLSGCRLDRASLWFSTANGALFVDGSLLDCDFTKAQLEGADFSRADASRARFIKATLTDARFDGAALSGTDFNGATAFRASFRGADLRGARLPVALDGAALDDATLDSTTTFDPSFDLSVVQLNTVIIDGTRFEGSEATSALARLLRIRS